LHLPECIYGAGANPDFPDQSFTQKRSRHGLQMQVRPVISREDQRREPAAGRQMTDRGARPSLASSIQRRNLIREMFEIDEHRLDKKLDVRSSLTSMAA
jgi:hypothetical protein